MYAPIALFVYNRCDHVKQTLEALAKNTIASQSELYIFSDGPKNEAAASRVEEVRALIGKSVWKEKFRAVHIIASDENKGLASSIITGVSKVMEQHGSAVILEDDCVTSPDFLEFMNRGLEYFCEDKTVGAICGYTFLKQFPKNYPHDIFALRRVTSYCWASWKRVWDLVDWNVSDYSEFATDFRARREFNRYGQDLCSMLDYQTTGKGSSWAVRFDYTLFRNGLRTIHSCQTKAKNVGYDEGTHVGKNQKNSRKFVVDIPDNPVMPKLENVEENPEIRKSYAAYFKRNLPWRIGRYVRDVVLRLHRIKRGRTK